MSAASVAALSSTVIWYDRLVVVDGTATLHNTWQPTNVTSLRPSEVSWRAMWMHEHNVIVVMFLRYWMVERMAGHMGCLSRQLNKLYAIYPNISGYQYKSSLSHRDAVLIKRLRIGHTRLTHSYLLSGDDQLLSSSSSNFFINKVVMSSTSMFCL